MQEASWRQYLPFMCRAEPAVVCLMPTASNSELCSGAAYSNFCADDRSHVRSKIASALLRFLRMDMLTPLSSIKKQALSQRKSVANYRKVAASALWRARKRRCFLSAYSILGPPRFQRAVTSWALVYENHCPYTVTTDQLRPLSCDCNSACDRICRSGMLACYFYAC